MGNGNMSHIKNFGALPSLRPEFTPKVVMGTVTVLIHGNGLINLIHQTH